MRRLGKMLFGAITVAVIGGTGLCANSSICRAAGENLTVGEVYNTALDPMAIPSAVYMKTILPALRWKQRKPMV